MWNKFFCQREIDKDYKINKNFNLLLYKIRGKNYPRYCFVLTPEVKENPCKAILSQIKTNKVQFNFKADVILPNTHKRK